MSYSFKKSHMRLLSLALVLLLVCGMFAGCKKSPDAETVPTTEDNLPPGLVEVKPTEDTTEITQPAEPIDENSAVVIVDVADVRQTPSMDDKPIGHLNKGTRVTIVREVNIGGAGWTLIREGWVPTDAIEKSFVPEPTTGEDEPTGTDTPPETKPNEKPNDSTTANNGNGTKGVVTASELNIRKEPSQTAERVDAYKAGDRVTILETKNGWGRTNKGWISLNYVYQDGTKGANPANGVITGNQLNVRSGPGTNYDRVDSLNFGARVEILERITIGGTQWACIKGGWISMEFVYVDGTTGAAAGTGTVNGDQVNVRSGPGTNFGAVGSKNTGDPVTVYAQFTIGDMTWGCIGNAQWISMKYVNMG